MKMHKFWLPWSMVMGMACSVSASGEGPSNVELYPELGAFVKDRIAEFEAIPSDRKLQLQQLALAIQRLSMAGQPAKLTFICTHNSRRSHMSQLWAVVAAAWYGLDGVEAYSGGTESTAFNPRAVAAMERAGFRITKRGESTNPHYLVRFTANGEPHACFSKRFDSEPNPTADFCAILVCSQADESCPIVRGAVSRIAIPFEDPKVADGTPAEAETYDERCAQIARELLYAFSQVK